MRELDIEMDGRQIKLAATFKASLELAEKVGDPLTIMREAALEQMFLSVQIPYEPKWRFTVQNIPLILWIGSKAAGGSMKLDEFQELAFTIGFAQAREIASDYLALIAGPRPEESGEDKEGEK